MSLSFRDFLEGANDEAYRQQAMSIADRLIAFIATPQNRWGKGLPYDYYKGFDLTEIIPEEKALFLKFMNQAGFGKNRDDLGNYSSNTIRIALPARTLPTAVYSVWNDRTRMRINPETVLKFLNKPENYKTFIHEIIHHIDTKRTKGKVNRNYPKERNTPEYFNHPAELNTFLQEFIVGLHRAGIKDWETAYRMLSQEHWFTDLNPTFKRHAIKRLYAFIHPDQPAS